MKISKFSHVDRSTEAASVARVLSRKLKAAGFPRYHVYTSSYRKDVYCAEGFCVRRVGYGNNVVVGWIRDSSCGGTQLSSGNKQQELIQWVRENTGYPIDDRGHIDVAKLELS